MPLYLRLKPLIYIGVATYTQLLLFAAISQKKPSALTHSQQPGDVYEFAAQS